MDNVLEFPDNDNVVPTYTCPCGNRTWYADYSAPGLLDLVCSECEMQAPAIIYLTEQPDDSA